MKLLKRLTAILLAVILVIPSVSSIGTVRAAAAGTEETAVLADENFEGTSFSSSIQGRGATIAAVNGEGVSGSKALLVSGRTQTWQGVNFDAKAYAGQKVTVTAQVKSKSSAAIKISIQIGEGDSVSYQQVVPAANVSGEYTTLSGSYVIPSGKTPVYLYIETDNLADFYVDNFTIEGTKTQEKTIQEDLLPLKTFMAQDSSIAGKMGVAIPVSALEDTALMKLVTKHFSSITCENEMKPDSFLGYTPTLDSNGNFVLNYSAADKVMDYVLEYNKNHPNDIIHVRGHVLLWHSQTPDWFFKVGYSTAEDAAYVSKDEMLKRMDSYIKQVMEHFDGADSKYKGIIYAWDVVNEQIDGGGIRVNNGSKLSNWYQVFGGDDLYIKEAFRLANKYAPANIKLFYNDYGDADSAKSDQICKLIKEIKAYDGARIDGMGMQAHYNMVSPSVEDFEKAIRKYAAVVDEIQLTELDLASSSDYDGTNQQAEYTKQAYRYKELFDKLYELDHEDGINITAVTVWGTHDGASWLQGSSSAGGGADGVKKQCPLLFDDNYQAKPAYYGIVDYTQLEPLTNSSIALYSAQNSWKAAPKTTYTSKGTEVSFQTIWSNDKIKVKVKVKDSTVSKKDKILVYVDKTNSKSDSAKQVRYTLKRSKATADKGGYEGIVSVPVSSLSAGKIIGFDVAVINDGVRVSWNDFKNMQDSTSKYYGELTLKPYTAFHSGTPVIDGKMDKLWKNQSAFPLTVKTGSPQATANVRAMWDKDYLYIYAEVKDTVLLKANTNAWEQDSFEIFLDQNNAKTTSYEADDCQYRINFDNEATFNGTNCKAENLKSAVKRTKNGYVVEAAIKWTDIKPAKGTLIGVDFQINDDAGTGSRAGTINWYDLTGTGYTNPSIFGTAALIK